MSPLVKDLHGDKFDQLKGLISGEEGVLVSLRAPRAGYGKTMLLSRLREEMQGCFCDGPDRSFSRFENQ